MKKWVDIEFEIGDTVYLKTDRDQNSRMVTGMLIRRESVTYQLTCGTAESWHYGFEISNTVNVLVKVTDL